MSGVTESIANRREAVSRRIVRDLVVPLLVAAVPSGRFRLLGLLTKGFDKPGMALPVWLKISMPAVLVVGILAMAMVVLAQFDYRSRALMALTNGVPAIWRRFALLLSMICLLLFYILTCVSTAFTGADFLWLLAVPFFVAHKMFGALVLAGRGQTEQEPSSVQQNP